MGEPKRVRRTRTEGGGIPKDAVSDRLKQIEARVNQAVSTSAWAVSIPRAEAVWLLAQLRAAEEEIDRAISLTCELCGDGIPVERDVVEAGPTEIVFWRHREDGKIVADCTQDAADIHERRYQRQQGE